MILLLSVPPFTKFCSSVLLYYCDSYSPCFLPSFPSFPCFTVVFVPLILVIPLLCMAMLHYVPRDAFIVIVLIWEAVSIFSII